MFSRASLIMLAIGIVSCARTSPDEPVAIAEPPPRIDAPLPVPSPEPTASTTATAPPPEWKDPPKEVVLAKRLTLTSTLHGTDGRLDVFREQQNTDYLPALDTILKLVPKSGAASNLTFKYAYDPTAYSKRFGDASSESIVIEYDARWETGYAHRLVVVEIENGNLIWRHATHPVTGAKHAIEATLATFSGGAQAVGATRATPSGGAEILAVYCGEAKKQTCTSTNRVFYVRDGKWWWNEQGGTACKPKSNGWCAAMAATFPDRSEFPSP